MSVLSSQYTPNLNLSQTPSSVGAAFGGSGMNGGQNAPIYAPGGQFNPPATKPLTPLDTSSPQNTLKDVMGQETSAYNQGITANQDLMQAVLGGYQSLYGSQMQGLQNYGQSQQNQLSQLYAGQHATTAQSLIGSGLNNTTVAQAEQQGITNQNAIASNQLSGQLQQQYLSTQQQNAGGYLNALQGLNFQYPTLGQIGGQALTQQQITNSTPPNPYLLAGAQGLTSALGIGGGIGIGSLLGSLFKDVAPVAAAVV